MTKEELIQEAEEWLCNNLHSASEEDFIKAMVDIAEPREKKIKTLGERCLQLQKDKGELIDKVRELEKENAELRKDKKELCHSISEGGKACVYLNEQLTKAKELLKQFLNAKNGEDTYKAEWEAEQFISEVEK